MDQLAFITGILLPALWGGFGVTLGLIAATAPFGVLIGAAVAVGRVYGARPVQYLARAYVAFFKGCPLLLLLFILYFGLPSVGISLSPFVAAVLGFIFCNSAYDSEYIRGSIKSIKEGQFTAGLALGMSRAQVIRYVILPQAMHRSIPGLVNEFVYLIKYSSLAYMITVIELTGAGKMIATRYFTYNETFFVVGLVYLALVTVTTIGAHLLERRVAVPGLVSTRD